jgi:hypothetical protein
VTLWKLCRTVSSAYPHWVFSRQDKEEEKEYELQPGNLPASDCKNALHAPRVRSNTHASANGLSCYRRSKSAILCNACSAWTE